MRTTTFAAFIVSLVVVVFSVGRPDASAANPVYTGPVFDAHCHAVRPADAWPAGRRGQRSSGGGAISPVMLFDRLKATGVTGVYFFAPYDVTTRLQRPFGDFAHGFANVSVDPQRQELELDDKTAGWIDEQLTEGLKGVGEIPL